jgi:DNA-binding NarL/FixJ family response regulator
MEMTWEPETGAGVRVLLVDDDSFHREALREVLESLEFKVVGEAADGMEAISQAEATNPQVVLMDLRMPVLGGIESTQQIRQRLPEVQVIILTAFDDFGLRVAAEEVGAYCYLPKGSSAQLISHSILLARAYTAS